MGGLVVDLDVHVTNESAVGTDGIDGAVVVFRGQAEAPGEEGDDEGDGGAPGGLEEEGESDEVGEEAGEGEE
jgi:hypothetical protein